MAHFAEIDQNNKVIDVLVVDNSIILDDNDQEYEQIGIDFLQGIFGQDKNYLQTSYNTKGGVNSNGGSPIRKNYAGIGYDYDSTRDAFIPPRPYSSWTLDETTCLWEPPVPYPSDGHIYTWDEDNQQWV